MKVLVTGGAGFIGSHVVDKLLSDGHSVAVVDDFSSGNELNVRKGVTYHRTNLNDPKLADVLREEKPEAICHLAAKTNMRESLDDPFSDIEGNVRGLVALLELATKKYPIKKFVFSCTGGALYGDPEYVPVDENHPTRPTSPYGISKLSGEKYLYYYNAVHNLPSISLRYSNVYGPRNERKKHNGAVTVFIQRVLKGEPIKINGSGEQTRDFIFVEDVARANAAAVSADIKGADVCNISGGSETSVNSMIEIIEKHAGKKAQVEHAPEIKGEIMRSFMSNQKAKDVLGWSPSASVDDGIKKTVEYFVTL
ncbi:NAD-dependent epimerase/dehydratase family protein [Candidatus Parcubacteria bacterium]|nr:MAG: NAD-dependent epimerase/dehydratase family protein [Candidatus Parcubacteria bacterium]